MRKCARPKGRADAMTVHLLTSAKKPLLDFVRQRLLPLEPCEVRTVLVPVAQETAEDVAQALGLVPGDSGFASMPGLHVVLCGETRPRQGGDRRCGPQGDDDRAQRARFDARGHQRRVQTSDGGSNPSRHDGAA